MLLKILCLSTTFNSEKSANTQESEQQDSVDQEIENLRLFLLKKIYLLKKLKSCLVGTETRKINTSCQVCKKISFDTTIFCLFWKVIFKRW